MNASTKPIVIVRYRELSRRLQLKAVYHRIQNLKQAVQTAATELARLESTLVGKTGGAG